MSGGKGEDDRGGAVKRENIDIYEYRFVHPEEFEPGDTFITDDVQVAAIQAWLEQQTAKAQAGAADAVRRFEAAKAACGDGQRTHCVKRKIAEVKLP